MDARMYEECRPDLEAVAMPLFDIAEKTVCQQGGFLPFGTTRRADGRVTLVGTCAAEDFDQPTSWIEEMPLLLRALRREAADPDVVAVAMAEDVTVTFEKRPPSKAIKVLFEHRRGLTVALYRPWRKGFLGRATFEESICIAAQPEICGW